MTDRTAPSSDARKRNAEAAQDPDAFTRGWLRWVDESQHFTPAHPLHLSRFTQENPMPNQNRHDELVALLTEIRDRLPEPEGAKDEPAQAFYDPDLAARNPGDDPKETR